MKKRYIFNFIITVILISVLSCTGDNIINFKTSGSLEFEIKEPKSRAWPDEFKAEISIKGSSIKNFKKEITIKKITDEELSVYKSIERIEVPEEVEMYAGVRAQIGSTLWKTKDDVLVYIAEDMAKTVSIDLYPYEEQGTNTISVNDTTYNAYVEKAYISYGYFSMYAREEDDSDIHNYKVQIVNPPATGSISVLNLGTDEQNVNDSYFIVTDSINETTYKTFYSENGNITRTGSGIEISGMMEEQGSDGSNKIIPFSAKLNYAYDIVKLTNTTIFAGSSLNIDYIFSGTYPSSPNISVSAENRYYTDFNYIPENGERTFNDAGFNIYDINENMTYNAGTGNITFTLDSIQTIKGYSKFIRCDYSGSVIKQSDNSSHETSGTVYIEPKFD